MTLRATFRYQLCFSKSGDVERDAQITKNKENAMDLSVVADWFTILFFLWFGLKQFIPALDKGFFPYIGGVIALAAALFTALST
jgi:hypothetical protein